MYNNRITMMVLPPHHILSIETASDTQGDSINRSIYNGQLSR
ncbi:MAG: hypothetical protein OJF51_002621 [Nitrospira sp.]|nr:MAG: hypothetical protein OJF51_002621 [Nitrospira sp.]